MERGARVLWQVERIIPNIGAHVRGPKLLVSRRGVRRIYDQGCVLYKVLAETSTRVDEVEFTAPVQLFASKSDG